MITSGPGAAICSYGLRKAMTLLVDNSRKRRMKTKNVESPILSKNQPGLVSKLCKPDLVRLMFVTSLLISWVLFAPILSQAQGIGLYKDGVKVLDFEDMTAGSNQGEDSPRASARMELMNRMLGDRKVNSFSEWKQYLQTISRCRELVRIARVDSDSIDIVSNQLSALCESMENARHSLDTRMTAFYSELLDLGCSPEMITQRAAAFEGHRRSHDQLLKLLTNLKEADSFGINDATLTVLEEIDRFFLQIDDKDRLPEICQDPVPALQERRELPPPNHIG